MRHPRQERETHATVTGRLSARVELTLSLVLLAAGIGYLAFHLIAGYGSTAIDLEYIWISGSLWLEGSHAYGAPFAERARAIFADGHVPEFFTYPLNWSVPAMLLATLKFETATLVWRLLCAGGLLASALVVARAFRAARQPVPVQAIFLCLAYLCLMQATPIVLTLGQTPILILLGVSLVLYGAAARNAIWLTVGMIVVMLKPQIGLPIVVALLAFPRLWPSIAVAALASILLAVPALVAGGAVDTIVDYVANVGRHNALLPNNAASTTGPRNLIDLFFGIKVSVLAVLAAAVAVTVALTLILMRARPGDPLNPARAVLAALALTLAVVPLHTYDFVLTAPLLMLALVCRHPARWMLALGLVVIFRSDNLGKWTGLYGAETVYFPGSLLATLAALAMLAATVWLVMRAPFRSDRPRSTGQAE
jgi:hypothetical protein